VNPDVDGDGYNAVAAGGDDCNDNDASVHPGATEVYYDGVDSNCDGVDDFDRDGDGYEGKIFNTDPTAGGGDCDDANASIHPGATDAYYDGVDSNCDGSNDYDQDGDGFSSSKYGGTDCNDTDATINTAAVEVFDGKDNNCDGLIDNHTTADAATTTLIGDLEGDGAGGGVAAGDYDGNGIADLAIGAWNYSPVVPAAGPGSPGYLEGVAQGEVAVFRNRDWSSGDTLAYADNDILGENSTSEFGSTVADIGDFDGDGIDDLGVAAVAYASKAGRVYVFSGANLDSAVATDAIATINGADDYSIGGALMTTTDLNGDGMADVIAYGYNSQLTYNYVAVQYGGTSGDYAWGDIDATWKEQCGDASTTSSAAICTGPTTSSGEAGGSPTFVQNGQKGYDIDGDGIQDLLIADPYNDDTKKQTGRVWVLWGKSAEFTTANGSLNATATTIMEGSSVHDNIGQAAGVTHDANDDGAAEIEIDETEGRARPLDAIASLHPEPQHLGVELFGLCRFIGDDLDVVDPLEHGSLAVVGVMLAFFRPLVGAALRKA
jgi:hypothetical protein